MDIVKKNNVCKQTEEVPGLPGVSKETWDNFISSFVPHRYFAALDYLNGNKEAPKDYEKGVSLLTEGAECDNYAPSQFALGVCYAEGIGVYKDYTKALAWWEAASQQGYADAEFNLSCAYMRGDIADLDTEKGVFWTMKAAKNGNAIAQANLGTFYAHGHYGITRNWSLAKHWWELSAEQGNKVAQDSLERYSELL